MSESLDARTNGDGEVFSVGAVLDLIVPFEFPFEGQKLKGQWYKYRTTTKEYIRERVAERNEQIDRFEKLRREINTLASDDPRVPEMIAECERLEQVVDRTNYSWLTDAVTEWNMVLKGEKVPLTAEGLVGVPIPLLVALDQFLINSRTDKNPTSSDS